jgi:formylglycine-generating enzyme required for sulfatase activity
MVILYFLSCMDNVMGWWDMSGNAWEWCWDAFGANRRDRGGSWNCTASSCTVVNQDFATPTSCVAGFGFRVVLSSVP